MLKICKLQISGSRFYEQHKADIKLWCYFVLFQQMCRLYFICMLFHYLAPETRVTTIIYAMIHGLRFDSLWATCWLFVALICFTLPSLFIDLSRNKNNTGYLHRATNNQSNLQTCRRYLGGVFTIVTIMMYIASIEYYREYKDIFNQFLFGWLYDDKMAILKTIYADHHVISNFILLLVILLLYIKYSPYFIAAKPSVGKKKYSVVHKTIMPVAIIFFYVASFRGGIGPRPIQLKDAGVTTDIFLNKAIVSPYSAFKYALKEYLVTNKNYNNVNFSVDDIQTSAQNFFGKNQNFSSLAKYMEKTAKGSMWPKPKHIFVIVGESLDAWHLQEEYRKFNLTPNLRKMIDDGIYFKYFLSCSYNTIGTLSTIMTGIPDMDLHINYQKSSYFPYSTTLATQFKKMGFKPQFFYGGYLSWQRFGDFAYAQGFSEVYGAAHMGGWRQTNEWGVDDRALFEFVIATVNKEKKPTFNIIMTTSNHPPFSINLEKEGFYREKVENLLVQYPTTDTNVKELGHIWYTDKTINEFVNKMIAIDDTSLFVITGDHFGRRHILPYPPSFDTAAVPLIIYSARIKNYCNLHSCKESNLVAGSHLDLGATLIELVAPKGFTYYSIGEDLLAKRKFNFGVGRDRIITTDFIASTSGDNVMFFKKSNIKTENETVSNQLNVLRERFNQVANIARYIIKNGETLYKSNQVGGTKFSQQH